MTGRLPTCSVVIPTLERGGPLLDTLQSLLAQEPSPLEIIVVDQTAIHPDAVERRLRQFEACGAIVRIREAIANLPRARNIGLLHARGEIVMFLDDDVLLPRGFVVRHLRHYADGRMDGVTGMILHEGERPSDRPHLPVPSREGARRLDLQIMRYRTSIRNPAHFVGANMSFRRSSLMRIDGFSHLFSGSALGEEVEAVGRLHRAGFQTVYDPACHLLHRVAPSGGCRDDAVSTLARSRQRQRNLFFALFHGLGTRAALLAIRRRLLNRVKTSGGAGTTVKTRRGGRLPSLLGRLIGGMEGTLLAFRHWHRGGDLLRLYIPAGGPPDISIVIPTYQRGAPLVATIRHLLALREAEMEILVVDQTEKHDPETRIALQEAEKDPRLSIFRTDVPNASRARNMGAMAARAPIILFLDDDITPQEGLLAEHLRQYADQTISCVGGRVARSVEELANPSPAEFGEREAATHPELPVCYTATPISDALHLITCNMSVRKDRLLEIGGFNEAFPGYGEDIELVARLRRAGGRAVYNPTAAVLHHSEASGGTRAAIDSPFRFGLRRGRAHHYSTLLAVGFLPWIGYLYRRTLSLLRRTLVLAGILPSRGASVMTGPVRTILASNNGKAAGISRALAYKAPQVAGYCLGAVRALCQYVATPATPKTLGIYQPTLPNRRLLIVCGALEPGGIQNLLLGTVSYLQRLGWRIDIATMSRREGAWEGRFAGLGCRVLHFPSGRSPFRFLTALCSHLRACPYDVLHLHRSSHAIALPILAGAVAGIPRRLAHYHNVRRRLTIWDPILSRIVLRFSTAILAPSRECLRSQFPHAYSKSTRRIVLRNGIDVEAFQLPMDKADCRSRFGLPQEALIIGHLGRFSAAKNQEFLIRLMPHLKAHHPGITLVLAGEGPGRSRLEELAGALGVYQSVHFPGWVENTSALLQSLDLFLFPSSWEGFGLALLEAQAAGCPCVATPLDCFRPLLSPSNRDLCQPLEDPQGWVDLIVKLLEDEERRASIGREGMAYSRRFDLRRHAEKLHRLYGGGAAP